MNEKPQAAEEEQIRAALNMHWRASAAGDADAEHDIYDDDAICDYPQSGERIVGRSNLQALRSHHPGKPSGFKVKRILGKGDLWITEYTITYQERLAYTVSIMELRDGKVVHETWKPFAAFPPSAPLAVVVGDPTGPGPYLIRVRVPAGVNDPRSPEQRPR
jgi:hypothetical protein